MARELTEKQEAYCRAVADTDSDTFGKRKESAIAAGYAEDSPTQAAWKCENNPLVKARIEELKVGQCDKSGLTESKILCDLEHNRRVSMEVGTATDRVNAREISKLQGQHRGMWKVEEVTDAEQEQLSEKDKAEAREYAAWSLRQGLKSEGGAETKQADLLRTREQTGVKSDVPVGEVAL